MNAAGVVASITDAHAFMSARGASISSSLVDNLVTQIAVQIASLATFTIGGATAITDAIKGESADDSRGSGYSLGKLATQRHGEDGD